MIYTVSVMQSMVQRLKTGATMQIVLIPHSEHVGCTVCYCDKTEEPII